MNFSEYQFRASQCHLLMTGTIGLTDIQEQELEALVGEEKTGINTNGNKVKWTPTKDAKLKELQEKKANRELPKTMQTELRKLWRAEIFKRNFVWTNKFVQKGKLQEDEAVTMYQDYRNEILGVKTFFKTSDDVKIRLKNEWFSGEPDLVDTNDFNKCNEGFDVKSSWSLDTFPFPEDKLSNAYYGQNQVYMNLTNTKKWTTAFCLVNGTEHLVNNEKQKHFYALNMPGNFEDEHYDDYLNKCRDVEKMMIFDQKRFIDVNPFHNLEIEPAEWQGEGYDIPLKDKVIEKISTYDENYIEDLKERILIARKYLNQLSEQSGKL